MVRDAVQERLYWIDRFDPCDFRSTVDERELSAWDVPQKIGCIALCKDGRGRDFTRARTGSEGLFLSYISNWAITAYLRLTPLAIQP